MKALIPVIALRFGALICGLVTFVDTHSTRWYRLLLARPCVRRKSTLRSKVEKTESDNGQPLSFPEGNTPWCEVDWLRNRQSAFICAFRGT
jgi:hypothetical protein